MVNVGQHPNIKLMSYSEVEDVSGYVGNFKVKVRRKARHVDEEKCTGCGQCVEHCLVRNKAYLEPAAKVEIKLEPEERAKVTSILDKHKSTNGHPDKGSEGALLPILQDIQEGFGWLPENVLRYLSERINVPLGQIYRLATFYNAFSLTPRGKYLIRVCMGTACYVKGANRILEALQKDLGIEAGQITKDKQFSLETVNCVGCCGQAPVVTVNDEIFGYFKQTKVPKLIDSYTK
jgi:NADH:ubiquinone oxidoreductase subunit E